MHMAVCGGGRRREWVALTPDPWPLIPCTLVPGPVHTQQMPYQRSCWARSCRPASENRQGPAGDDDVGGVGNRGRILVEQIAASTSLALGDLSHQPSAPQ